MDIQHLDEKRPTPTSTLKILEEGPGDPEDHFVILRKENTKKKKTREHHKIPDLILILIIGAAASGLSAIALVTFIKTQFRQ